MTEEGKFVCPTCRVYCREERSDGCCHYTVCSYCGRSELLYVTADGTPRNIIGEMLATPAEGQ